MPTLRADYMVSQGTGTVGEPLRGCTFEVVIPFLANVTLFVDSMTTPNYTLNQVEVHHFNEKLKIAGKPDIPNISLVVRDVVTPNLMQQMWLWFNLGYQPLTGQIGYASTYKQMGFLQQFDTMGVLHKTWELVGLWIVSINPGQHDYTSDAPLQITLDMSCDRALLV